MPCILNPFPLAHTLSAASGADLVPIGASAHRSDRSVFRLSVSVRRWGRCDYMGDGSWDLMEMLDDEVSPSLQVERGQIGCSGYVGWWVRMGWWVEW